MSGRGTPKRKQRVAVAVVTAASLGAAACATSSTADAPPTTEESTTTTSTTEATTTTSIEASTTTSRPATPRTTRAPQPATTTTSTSEPPVIFGCPTTTEPPTTTTTYPGQPIAACGRPYRRRRRRGLILPDVSDVGPFEGSCPDDFAELTDDERVFAGRTWLADARSEMASVPAFAELSLHLSYVGAPIELITAAHEAALDELRHATTCLETASALLGRRYTLEGVPSIAGRRVAGRWWWSRRRHLVELAVRSLIDGCISEANSADHLRDRAASSAPTAADAANRLADDEDRHTDLAWAIVDWCSRVGGKPVHDALVGALDKLPWTDDLVASARARVAV